MPVVTTFAGNPYVGPQPYFRDKADVFFGRDRELRELTSLLIAQRIVLLCSPSGAGKTSLIRAGLIPELEKRKFEVLPVAYVSADPGGDDHRCSPNRYVESVLRCLEMPEPGSTEDSTLFGSNAPWSDSRELTLSEYLQLRTPQPGTAAQVLIFDQFEEIITMDPTDLDEKEEFFRQLGVALADTPSAEEAPWLTPPPRWAVFAMREEFIVALDRYLKYIPTRLGTRFRLEFLRRKAALRAIREPTRRADVEFQDEAASKLFLNLAVMRRIAPGKSTAREVPGEYVEPVHLQIICHRLWERCQTKWEKNPGQPRAITEVDLEEDDGDKMAGYVDTALAAFYAEKVRNIAESQCNDISERRIRWWIEEQLITPNGIRGHVLKGSSHTEGMPNHVVRWLEKSNLVRSEERHGAFWVELAHDRLIRPVRTSNREWYEQCLHPTQRAAHVWDISGRPESLLLRSAELREARKHCSEADEVERDFLDVSRAKAARERSRHRIRRLVVMLSLALLVAIAVTTAASLAWLQLRHANDVLQEANEKAKSNELVASALQEWNIDPRSGFEKAYNAWRCDPRGGGQDSPDEQSDRGNDGGFPAEEALIGMLVDSGGTPLVHRKAHHLGQIRAIQVADDWIITASADATAILWDRQELIDKGRVETPIRLKGHWRPIIAATTNDQENRLITGSVDETVRIWDLSTDADGDRQKFLLETKSVVTQVTTFQEEAGGKGGSEEGPSQERSSEQSDEAVSTDAEVTWICSGHAGGDIYLWRWDEQVWKNKWDEKIKQNELDDNSGENEKEGEGTPQADYDLRISAHRGPISVVQTPIGKEKEWLATAGYDGTVRIWKLPDLIARAKDQEKSKVLLSDEADELSYVLRGHVGRVQDIQFNRYVKSDAGSTGGESSGGGSSPEQVETFTRGMWLVTAGDDGSARLWDVDQIANQEMILPAGWATEKVLDLRRSSTSTLRDEHKTPAEDISRPITAHNNEIVDIAISKKDTYLVTASVDGAAYVWNLKAMLDKEKFEEANEEEGFGEDYAFSLRPGSGTAATEGETRITDISTDPAEIWIGTGTNNNKAYVWRILPCEHKGCSNPTSLFCDHTLGRGFAFDDQKVRYLRPKFELDLGSRVGAIEFWESNTKGYTLFSTACDGGMARIWKLPTSGAWEEYEKLFLDLPRELRRDAIATEINKLPDQKSEKIRERVDGVLARWGRDATD